MLACQNKQCQQIAKLKAMELVMMTSTTTSMNIMTKTQSEVQFFYQTTTTTLAYQLLLFIHNCFVCLSSFLLCLVHICKAINVARELNSKQYHTCLLALLDMSMLVVVRNESHYKLLLLLLLHNSRQES